MSVDSNLEVSWFCILIGLLICREDSRDTQISNHQMHNDIQSRHCRSHFLALWADCCLDSNWIHRLVPFVLMALVVTLALVL